MAKTHPPYASEYQRQRVEIVPSGRTPKEPARAFECSASAIRNRVRQAGRDEGRREDGRCTPLSIPFQGLFMSDSGAFFGGMFHFSYPPVPVPPITPPLRGSRRSRAVRGEG